MSERFFTRTGRDEGRGSERLLGCHNRHGHNAHVEAAEGRDRQVMGRGSRDDRRVETVRW